MDNSEEKIRISEAALEELREAGLKVEEDEGASEAEAVVEPTVSDVPEEAPPADLEDDQPLPRHQVVYNVSLDQYQVAYVDADGVLHLPGSDGYVESDDADLSPGDVKPA
jgi:hypothetical protein